MSKDRQGKQRDPDMVGAEAAMLRAAIKARKRALATAGSYPTTGSYPMFKDGQIVYMTDMGELGEETDAPVAEGAPAD